MHIALEPLQLLWHISERLLQSATQRYMQLDSTDIARTVSWTQIVAAQDCIRSLQMSGTPSGLCAESAQDQVHEPSFLLLLDVRFPHSECLSPPKTLHGCPCPNHVPYPADDPIDAHASGPAHLQTL